MRIQSHNSAITKELTYTYLVNSNRIFSELAFGDTFLHINIETGEEDVYIKISNSTALSIIYPDTMPTYFANGERVFRTVIERQNKA